jgi:hypothetical protein
LIGPAPVLAAIVGLFHASAYVFIRGRAGARVPLLVVAAVLGAWAGDAIGTRLAIDPVRIGEFNLVFASLLAWVGIGIVAVVSVLVPERRARIPERRIETVLTHARPADDAATAEGADQVAEPPVEEVAEPAEAPADSEAPVEVSAGR